MVALPERVWRMSSYLTVDNGFSILKRIYLHFSILKNIYLLRDEDINTVNLTYFGRWLA